MSTFGVRLKVTAARKHVSQADLAAAAGIKPSSMSDWFSDKTTPGSVKALPLVRAAAKLAVNPLWLLTGEGNEAPMGPAVLFAREAPAPPYGPAWPFPRLEPARYYALPDHTRRAIASYVDGVVLGTES
ncbi:MAG: hypothetical protein QM702_00080 [Rubrivivax sp.]